MTIGERVRDLRQSQRRTVTDVAAAAGLSRSFLTRVEAGEGNPRRDSLERLASALGVPVGEILGQDAAAASPGRAAVPSGRIEVVHRDREGAWWQEREHLRLAFLRSGPTDVIEVALESGAAEDGDPARLDNHGGDEFGIVLDGRYELVTAGARQVLEEGDSIRISGDIPHNVRPIGAGPNRILWILSPAT